jgi:uncharacterized protein YecT (DUF1311 family)
MTPNDLRMRMALLVAVVTLVTTSVDSDASRPDCREGGRSQIEMNACAGQKADAANKRLAAVLAELDGILQPEARQGLAGVQAHWVELRDLDCKWERSLFEGGSVAPMVYASCIATQTEQRIERLKPFLCKGAGMTDPCEALRKYSSLEASRSRTRG